MRASLDLLVSVGARTTNVVITYQILVFPQLGGPEVHARLLRSEEAYLRRLRPSRQSLARAGTVSITSQVR